jgi:hypothetical protein
MKTRPLGAELFHIDGRTDRQTDMVNLIVAFLNFLTRLKTYNDALLLRYRVPTNRLPSRQTTSSQIIPCTLSLT